LVALTFLVTASSAYLLFLHKVENDYQDDLQHTLDATAQTLALDLAPIMALDTIPPEGVRGIETTVRAIERETGTRIRILRSGGILWMDSSGDPAYEDAETLRLRPEIVAAMQGRYGADTHFSDLNVAVPIVSNGRQLGIVYATHSTDQIARRVDRIRQPLRGAIVSLGVVVAILGLFLTLNVRTMLEEVRAASSRMVAGNLGERVQVRARTEVSDIASHFNRLAASLQQKISELEDERDKMKRFIQDITHELKTPLTGLSGSVHALQNGAQDDPSQRQLFVGNIGRDSERLAELVSRMLEIQKLEYDALKPVRFDIASLADKVAAGFEADAARRGISFEVEGGGVECVADPGKIERVLENLVENAVRHSPDGGVVRIESRRETGSVVVDVSDEGDGIEPTDQPKVFERFFRGPKTGTGKLGAAGLGLSIAREIVQRHHGEIGVESVPGQGARFYFRLPATS
jgi:signal transduction histidine kinase